jgi:alkylation response protein AidB-like acyl-CoA dehydrogenase
VKGGDPQWTLSWAKNRGRCKVEGYMREAKIGQIVEGTNQIQRIIIARELLKR